MLRFRAVPGRVYWMNQPRFIWLVLSQDLLIGWFFDETDPLVSSETFTMQTGHMVEDFGNREQYHALNPEEWVE